MSTGDPTLDALLMAASYLFLAGILLVVVSGVPALARRFPRLLMVGFMLALASIALAFVSAIVLG